MNLKAAWTMARHHSLGQVILPAGSDPLQDDWEWVMHPKDAGKARQFPARWPIKKILQEAGA